VGKLKVCRRWVARSAQAVFAEAKATTMAIERAVRTSLRAGLRRLVEDYRRRTWAAFLLALVFAIFMALAVDYGNWRHILIICTIAFVIPVLVVAAEGETARLDQVARGRRRSLTWLLVSCGFQIVSDITAFMVVLVASAILFPVVLLRPGPNLAAARTRRRRQGVRSDGAPVSGILALYSGVATLAVLVYLMALLVVTALAGAPDEDLLIVLAALVLFMTMLVAPLVSALAAPVLAGRRRASESNRVRISRSAQLLSWASDRFSRSKCVRLYWMGDSVKAAMVFSGVLVLVLLSTVSIFVYIDTVLTIPAQLSDAHFFDWTKQSHLRAASVAAATAISLVFALDGLTELRDRARSAVAMSAHVLLLFALIGAAPWFGDWWPGRPTSGILLIGSSTIVGVSYGVYTAAFVDFGHALLALVSGFLTPVSIDARYSVEGLRKHEALHIYGALLPTRSSAGLTGTKSGPPGPEPTPVT
jgi:hypothetical protein